MKITFQKIVTNRYTFLFTSLLLLLLVEPLISDRIILMPFLLLFMIVTALSTLGLRRLFFRLYCFLAALVFLLDFALVHLSKSELLFLRLVTISIYSLLILIAILVLTWKIFSEENVTLDTILGGVAVYFLLGIFWALLYEIALIINPQALSTPFGHEFPHLLYFSFITLTTVGYGDIRPVSDMVRNLSVLEAVVGQLFLTIFIARLIGLHLTQPKPVKSVS